MIDNPMRRNPFVQMLCEAVGEDFAAASDHSYNCCCERCRDWWKKMEPDPDTETYGPFSPEEIEDD